MDCSWHISNCCVFPTLKKELRRGLDDDIDKSNVVMFFGFKGPCDSNCLCDSASR